MYFNCVAFAANRAKSSMPCANDFLDAYVFGFNGGVLNKIRNSVTIQTNIFKNKKI